MSQPQTPPRKHTKKQSRPSPCPSPAASPTVGGSSLPVAASPSSSASPGSLLPVAATPQKIEASAVATPKTKTSRGVRPSPSPSSLSQSAAGDLQELAATSLFGQEDAFVEEEADDDDDGYEEVDEASDLDGEEEVVDENEEEEPEEVVEKALEEAQASAAEDDAAVATLQPNPARFERPADESYKGDWTGAPEPGCEGFTSFAVKAMLAAGVAGQSLDSLYRDAASVQPGQCPPRQPHQDAAVFLLHPQSPISRLLVDHPTGSGKTREIIDILDNFFDDPRPKVPIFPKEPVCRNFYAELLRWPSKYRDFFCCLLPDRASVAAQVPDWRLRRNCLWSLAGLTDEVVRGLCKDLREMLEMKGWFYCGKIRPKLEERFKQRFPGERLPAAPLRALRYTSAGGSHAKLKEDGQPVSSLFKIGFDCEGKNVYSNKVVVMDEAHNLVRAQTQYQEQLSNLRELLLGAKGTVLAGFTGTPILGEVSEGRRLLDVIKGSKAADLNDEGFLSSFPFRPQPLFPRSLPQGLPDAVLTPKLRAQFVKKVQLQGETLQRYDVKRKKDLPERRLRAYCNLCVHFGSFHGGINGNRHRVLKNFADCAPKLHAIAKDVAAIPTKALVLIAKNSGMEALIAYLQDLGRTSVPSFGVATMDDLADFNSAENLRGERFRVLVADALTCSEGVSFFAVRRVLLADVPATPSAMVQSVGRAIRLFGHRGLPEEEQTVRTTLYIAGFPSWMRSSLSAWAFRVQKRHQDSREAETKARRLLRTLRKVGINTLADLKSRLDARKKRTQAKRVASEPTPGASGQEGQEAASSKQGQAEERPLSQEEETEQAAGLLEAIGLWEEARIVRKTFKEQMLQRQNQNQKRNLSRVASDSKKPLTLKARRVLQRAVSEAMATLAPQRELRRWASDASEPAVGLPTHIGTNDMTLLASSKASTDEAAVAETTPGSPPASEAKIPEVAEHKPQTEDAINKGAAAEVAAFVGADKPSSEGDKSSGKSPGDGDAVPQPKPPAIRRHYLVSALLALQAADSLEEAVAGFNLKTLTADEEAVQQLALKTKEMAPALADLRSLAVDREVLLGLERRDQEEKVEDSDGESCYSQFGGLDDFSDGEQKFPNQQQKQRRRGQPKQSNPLILPPGWQTQRVRRGKRESTIIIAPDGATYKTQAQAKARINSEWRARNMSSSLRSKFEDRLKQRQPELPRAAAPQPQQASNSSQTASDVVPAAVQSKEDSQTDKGLAAAPKRRRLTRKTKDL